MDIFNVLSMIGGLCLFLFGMTLMGEALERCAGGKLHTVLSRMTSNKFVGFLTGCGVTCVIQSSSATTVMVVGFVNSGLMTLRQAVNVIMGANVGTTITGWLLSLGGISGESTLVKLMKPSSFTPILALIGICFMMFSKKHSKKDIGIILLGFATLMFGMDTMSDAVSGLADVPQFQQLFIMFKNPILGLLAGALLTGVIQSSSAAVGILQALAMTGQVSFGAAIPIVMGTAIGTCVTAMLSSIGAKKEAKRAAVVHLLFNVVGSAIWLAVYAIVRAIFMPDILDQPASMVGVAVVNTAFKVAATVVLFPFSAMLVNLAKKLVPDSKTVEKTVRLDDRLLVTPPLALGQARTVAIEMAQKAITSLIASIGVFTGYSADAAKQIREDEDSCDELEDILGTYLVKLSAEQLGEKESEEATALLKSIGDLERISDHAVNILESAEELRDKNLTLTEQALKEYDVISSAVKEVLELSLKAFENSDVESAAYVEPLEQVIDQLKEQLRTNHILRMQDGKCSVQVGFVWSDILTNLERVSDHCSNIACCVIDMAQHNLNVHQSLRDTRHGNPQYDKMLETYTNKYSISI